MTETDQAERLTTLEAAQAENQYMRRQRELLSKVIGVLLHQRDLHGDYGVRCGDLRIFLRKTPFGYIAEERGDGR